MIAYIGFGFAAFFVVVIFFVALLFMIPNLNLFGATSVSLSNHYTTYKDDGVRAVLLQRNIIVESRGIDLEIRSRNYGQTAAGTIEVFENASGIAFNSLDRTLIDYMQYIDDDGEVWHKIVILQPEGAVNMKGYVYINLYASDQQELLPAEYRKPYNIILNTRNSKVSVATDPDSTYLRIDNMWLNGVLGTVNFPAVARGAEPVVDLGNLFVDSGSKVALNCRAPIRGSVDINGANGTYNMGNIGKEGEGAGNVKIRGDRNVFSTNSGAVLGDIDAEGRDVRINVGQVGGTVSYKAAVGNISVAECTRLNAEVADASVTVTGKINGGINTDSVPELKFTATGKGSCKVNGIVGVSHLKADNGGTIELRNVAGAVKAENLLGTTIVHFDETLDVNMQNPPTCEISAWYRDVTLSNLIGPTTVTAAPGGRTCVNAGFRAVRGTNIIDMQGETDARNRYHSVKVTLTVVEGTDPLPFNITAIGSSRAHNNTQLLNDNTVVMKNGQTYHCGTGSAVDVLQINTDDWFDFNSRTVRQ